MTLALLYGAGSGAVHAVTGPDHLLSLGPVAIEEKRAPFRVGLRWGLGHALGTLVLGLPVLLLLGFVPLPALAALGDRVAGVALIGLALWSWRALRRAEHAARAEGDLPARSKAGVVLVGFVHGLTGAASLLMVAPVAAAGSWQTTLAFLLAFAAGSTVAMGALTFAVARVGARLKAPLLARAQKLLLGAAALLGVGLVFG